MVESRHILFISYLFEPDNTVGSKRMSYWAKNWKKLHPADIVTVITNTSFETKSEGVDHQYHLPTSPSKSIISKGIKDEGLNWSQPIIDLTIKNELTPDLVLISGSPFMHFSTQSFFQKRGAKTIIDYRDPFSNNPRFGSGKIKIAIKSFFERKFNSQANAVLTVNNYCMNLMAKPASTKTKYAVIKNGYDDSITRSSEPVLVHKLETNFIYGGTFYESEGAQALLQILDPQKHKLHHIGATNNFSESLTSFPNYISYGLKKYDQLMKGLTEADVCIIFSSGQEFESTTKVYDYIAANKTIWIISPTALSKGALYEEIKNYPKVIFSNNDTPSLRKDLKSVISNIELSIIFDSSEYSRRNGLEKLSQLIDSL